MPAAQRASAEHFEIIVTNVHPLHSIDPGWFGYKPAANPAGINRMVEQVRGRRRPGMSVSVEHRSGSLAHLPRLPGALYAFAACLHAPGGI
jgi:hypothetical protein